MVLLELKNELDARGIDSLLMSRSGVALKSESLYTDLDALEPVVTECETGMVVDQLLAIDNHPLLELVSLIPHLTNGSPSAVIMSMRAFAGGFPKW